MNYNIQALDALLNISEEAKQSIYTYGMASVSNLISESLSEKINCLDRNNNIRTYFAKLAYSRIYAEETYIKFREYAPGDSFNSERTYSEKVITYIKNNILGERNE